MLPPGPDKGLKQAVIVMMRSAWYYVCFLRADFCFGELVQVGRTEGTEEEREKSEERVTSTRRYLPDFRDFLSLTEIITHLKKPISGAQGQNSSQIHRMYFVLIIILI